MRQHPRAGQRGPLAASPRRGRRHGVALDEAVGIPDAHRGSPAATPADVNHVLAGWSF
jgi:hypothetical protein